MKYTLPTLTALFLSTQVFVQAHQSEADGYIVLTNGDTLHGAVEYIDENSVHRDFYKKIRFTDGSGKQKKYKRKDVAAFRSGNSDYQSFWLSESSDGAFSLNIRYDIELQKGDQYFLKVIHRGALSHFELEWFEQGESLLMSMDLFKKEHDRHLVRSTQGVLGLKRKALRNYFSDCPELAEQIDRKLLKRPDEVVAFYNSKCGR